MTTTFKSAFPSSAEWLAVESRTESPNEVFVVIPARDFERILHSLHQLKGWSMHTENGEYEQNAAKLVVDHVMRTSAHEVASDYEAHGIQSMVYEPCEAPE